ALRKADSLDPDLSQALELQNRAEVAESDRDHLREMVTGLQLDLERAQLSWQSDLEQARLSSQSALEQAQLSSQKNLERAESARQATLEELKAAQDQLTKLTG